MAHPQRSPFIRGTATIALLAAAWLGAVAPAAAQWAWKDDNGRTVYSDRPPPASVRSDRIVRQPSNAQVVAPQRATEPAPTAQSADAKAAAPAAAPAAPKTSAELEAEFRKRQQDRADAEKKAQEEQARASAKAADCERAKSYLRALEDGIRIERTDSAGNREYLDDAQRAAEVERTRKLMQSACG